MRLIFLVLSVLISIACGRPLALEKHLLHPENGYKATEELKELREVYLNLVKDVQDDDGFVDTDKCDSLLHSALLGAGGATVHLSAAREESGRWLRRPQSYQECLASGGSRSTISRDMLLGVMWYAWATRDLKMAEDLWSFGESRDWKMGDSDNSADGISRIYMTPTMQATLAELIHRLGGANHTIRKLPARNIGNQTGFRMHLELLDLILWREMTGAYSLLEIGIIDTYLARHPSNALVNYAAGRYGKADRLLRLHHPEGRLPTSADMCSPMAYETETLDPCPNAGRTHAPIHYLFISSLLLKEEAT